MALLNKWRHKRRSVFVPCDIVGAVLTDAATNVKVTLRKPTDSRFCELVMNLAEANLLRDLLDRQLRDVHHGRAERAEKEGGQH